MADELGKIQILLEDIKGNVKAVAEGHSVLLNAINRVDSKLEEHRSDVAIKLDGISQVVKEIRSDLKDHIYQTVPPAHIAV